MTVAMGGFYVYLVKDLPAVGALGEYNPNLITKVYAADSRVVGEFYIERRIVAPMDSIPPHLVQAFLAAEDSKFFEHGGIDYLGILRALYKNLSAGRIVQGGSTITQQVARTFFLSSERKFTRKLREAILAFRIESQLSKKEILHLYLNQIYFGNGAYGVEAASETYYGKNVKDLSIAEAALLAGLPKAPNRYSPYASFELAKKRQEFVIARMLEEGFITKKEADDAAAEKLALKPRELRNLWVGPYFTEHIRRYIEEKYGDTLLYNGGLNIFTTMDVETQKAANAAVDYGIRTYDKRRGYRGPVRTLRTGDDIKAFLAEADQQMTYDPLRAGAVLQGVVASVDAAERTLTVNIGTRRGIILYPDLAWARLYNPTQNPDGGKFVNPMGLFTSGDVLEVRVKTLPSTPSSSDDNGSTIALELEQTPLIEGALIAMEPQTGYVKAMVGGSDFLKTQYNRAIQAKRQPGSAFKPIIYSAAIDSGYTPATVVVDSPIVFTGSLKIGDEEMDWKPRNFEEKFHGPTTVREAIAKSRNVVTVKVLKDIGVSSAISYARKLGIESPLASDLSLALGSSAVSLMEMTRAFATFANMGLKPEPVFITKVTDKDGNVLEERGTALEAVLSPQTSYIITNLLQGVIENGTGWRARALGRPVAGKTGTTNNLNDAWFIGYVPGLVAGVWVGYDNEHQLGHGETGAQAALPAWVKFMKEALEPVPSGNFPVPDGVEFVRIDPENGLLAGAATKNPVFEVFKVGTAPTTISDGKGASPGGEDFFLIDSGKEQEKEELKKTPRDKGAAPGAF
ncbi:MAG: PBP1A family penicillin-binding protein [Deltaproteobacteria bacterium]|nr:PBP1A family penicillin-binding protein [Deltaproteobacteria bacterium]